jgi:putative zinc finger/helix-turn-helix YgiT family protein
MNRENNPEGKSIDREEKDLCPNCGSCNTERVNDNYTFTYGAGDDAVDLSATVPIIKCGDCGQGFLDHIAEDICHEAVCRHLGVMTPSQIKDLRNLYGLTQAQFAEITKLGEATLSRWERGAVVQNEAYDNYLCLLRLPINFERIRNRGRGEEGEKPKPFTQVAKFREIEATEAIKEKQRNFKLIAVA